MSDYNKDFLALIVVLLGVGVIGSALSILWYRMTTRSAMEKGTIYFLVKLFMGISLALILVALVLRRW